MTQQHAVATDTSCEWRCGRTRAQTFGCRRGQMSCQHAIGVGLRVRLAAPRVPPIAACDAVVVMAELVREDVQELVRAGLRSVQRNSTPSIGLSSADAKRGEIVEQLTMFDGLRDGHAVDVEQIKDVAMLFALSSPTTNARDRAARRRSRPPPGHTSRHSPSRSPARSHRGRPLPHPSREAAR